MCHLSLGPTATATDPPPKYAQEAGLQRPKIKKINKKIVETQAGFQQWHKHTDYSPTLQVEKRILGESCLRFFFKDGC